MNFVAAIAGSMFRKWHDASEDVLKDKNFSALSEKDKSDAITKLSFDFDLERWTTSLLMMAQITVDAECSRIQKPRRV